MIGVASGATSLNPNQLIYSPSEDVYALAPGGKLLEPHEKAITFDLNLSSGKSCSVSVRKGRNRNILVSVTNVKVATSKMEGQPWKTERQDLLNVAGEVRQKVV